MQFKDPHLVQMVRLALSESGLPAEFLELELTESAVMADTAATTLTLRAFQKSGVHIALDDFGTGHSSLSYLKRMPLTRLKIDQSFVIGLPDDAENVAIVKAIVAMASSLGLNVTAEGVESQQQADFLRDIGCQTLQGYLYGRPMAVPDMDDLLSQRKALAKP